jgi:hypothetical protein
VEHHNLYRSFSVIRIMQSEVVRWDGHVAKIGGLGMLKTVVFNLFCSRTPRYNLYSTLYPQSCWYVMQVIHIV